MTATTATRLLSAGAILPVGSSGDGTQPSAQPVDRLDARTYRHGVLAHPVVLLVPVALAPGDDLVMDYLGCGAPGVAAGVGERARRAPGFPGWALINDPAHARHALEVVKRMKAAGRRIRSKVGQAWEGFEAIAGELGRSTAHFLPSFWEEAGRMLSDAGNAHYAGRAFGKAREAEKVHALDVDLTALRESFLEFSLRGAVSVKAISEFGKALTARHGAATAWEVYRDLALRRCQGGVPPWPALPGELGSLARAARRDRQGEALRLLAELLPLPAVRRAAIAFWEAAEGDLALLARDPAHARLLLEFVPTPGQDDFVWWWAERLQVWGLTAHAIAGRLPDGSAFDAGAWFERLVQQACAGRWGTTAVADCAFDLLTALAPRLRGGRALRLVGQHGKADLDLLHFALELGVPLADPPAQLDLQVVRWADPASGGPWRRQRTDGAAAPPHACRRRDPAPLLADPRFRPALVEGIRTGLGNAVVAALLATRPTLLAVAREWVAEASAAASNGALPALEAFAALFKERCSAALLAAVPGLREQADSFPVATGLARTIAAGLPDEFGWPLLEATIARLTPPPASQPQRRYWWHREVQVDGQPPYLVVRNSTHATVLGPDGVVLEHDFVLGKDEAVTGCLWLDGQLLVSVQQSWEPKGRYWSGQPAERFAGPAVGGERAEQRVDLPGLGTWLGRRAVRAGERAPQLEPRRLIGDGRTWWVEVEKDRQATLREADPATGDLGRASLPQWFEAGVQPGWRVDLAASSLHPVAAHGADAPLALRDGLGGTRVQRQEQGPLTRLTGIDGVSIELALPSTVRPALARWPGAAEPLVLWGARGLHLCRADGVVTASGRAYHLGHEEALAIPFWHQATLRDPATAAALRACTAQQAEELLDAGLADRLAAAAVEAPPSAHGPGGDRPDPAAWPRTVECLRALFQVADPRLCAGLLGVVDLAATVRATLKELVAVPAAGADEPSLGDGADLLLGAQSWRHGISTPSGLRAAAAWLRADADAVPPGHWQEWWCDPVEFRANLVQALLGDESQRQKAARFLRALVEAGFDRLPGACRQGAVVIDERRPLRLTVVAATYGQRFGTALADGNRFLVRERDAQSAEVVEYAPAGRFTGLPDAPFIRVADVPAAPPAALLLAAAGCLEQRPAPEPDAELLTRVAAALDATREDAALLLIARRRLDQRRNQVLPKELRERLGLTVPALAEAAERRGRLTEAVRQGLSAALLGDDPAGLWALETPGADGTTPLQRLAAAWRGRTEDAELVDAGPTIGRHLHRFHLTDLGRALAVSAAGGVPFPPCPAFSDPASDASHLLGHRFRRDGGDPAELAGVVIAVAAGIQLDLPAGDPSAARVAGFLPHLARAIDDPHRLLDVTVAQADPAKAQDAHWLRVERVWTGLAGARRHERPLAKGGSLLLREDGGLLAAAREEQGGHPVIHVFWRPVACRDGDDAQRLLALKIDPDEDSEGATYQRRSLAWIRRWRAPAVQRMLATLGAPLVPAGRYAADPRASAPAVVAAAIARLGLDEDAATAYLQVLALPEPRTADVARWNGWDERRTAAALDAAVAAGLLLTAQRKGAGRGVFLPGGWEADSALSAPLESWKLPLFGIARGRKGRLDLDDSLVLPLEPLGELFTRAWQRVVDGDAPRYEEVR